ncbi:hypothetical protein NIES4102_43220 (plasmid) [Chondrocystis sp. NIES-4102]|nr:hypothetical protein NIES4102_43220 [Chondrocystis sp. NIES-4102]
MTNILLHETLNSASVLSRRFFFQVPGEETISCCHLRFFLPPEVLGENCQNFFSRLKLRTIKPQIILLTDIRENRGNFSLSNSIEFVIAQIMYFLEIHYLETLRKKFPRIDLKNCIFIEHCNNFTYHNCDEDFDKFSLVKLVSKSAAPDWKSISIGDLLLIIQGKFKSDRCFNSFLVKNWNPYLIMTPDKILLESFFKIQKLY